MRYEAKSSGTMNQEGNNFFILAKMRDFNLLNLYKE